MKRSLSLRAETLAKLSDDELDGIVGGYDYSGNGFTCPLLRCQVFSDHLTCRCE